MLKQLEKYSKVLIIAGFFGYFTGTELGKHFVKLPKRPTELQNYAKLERILEESPNTSIVYKNALDEYERLTKVERAYIENVEKRLHSASKFYDLSLGSTVWFLLGGFGYISKLVRRKE